MPKPELKWYKQGEKSVCSLMNRKGAIGTRFTIVPGKKGKVFSLYEQGTLRIRGDKAECKTFAQEIVDKEWIAEVAPKVTSLWWYYGPDFHLVHKRKDKILKQAGLTVEDVTPAMARHAAHECNRLLSVNKRPKKLKEVTVPTPEYHTPQEATDKVVEKAFAQKAPQSRNVGAKPLTLPDPELREQKGLYRIYAPVFDPPFPLKNAKFKVLYRWCEKLRDFYQMRGIYLTAQALGNLAWRSFPKTPERGNKACARVFLIYEEELAQERERTRRMIESSKSKEKEENKRTGLKPVKDRWGYRIGSAAAKVNEVITKEPKTVKRIVFECDVPVARVKTHLNVLIRKKKVKKLPNGKYRERRTKK